MGDQKKYYHSCGVWLQASYINHSCTGNAQRAFIGNMIIVRASRDMDAGTEITFWYRKPEGTWASAGKSDKIFRHQWGFTCDCAICLDFREISGNLDGRRQYLLRQIEEAFDDLGSAHRQPRTQYIEYFLLLLNNTYTQKAHLVPRLAVWQPRLALTRLYAARSEHKKTVLCAARVLRSLSFVLSDAFASSFLLASSSSSPTAPPTASHNASPTAPPTLQIGSDLSFGFAVMQWGLLIDYGVVETFLLLRAAFLALGAREDARIAEGYARTAYKILVGEDATFKDELM